jgi:hypothetical protein
MTKRLALLSVITLLAGSATASIGGVATAGPISGLVHTRLDSFLSTNWAGYAATGATFTDVKGSWVQPAANCAHGRAIAAFWVGLDGYNSSTVEQVGTESDCVGAIEVYFAWYEFYPAGLVALDQTTYPVSPGDVICAEVSQDTSHVTVTLKDDTVAGCPDPDWMYINSDTPVTGMDFSSAEWIAEGPSRNLTDFTQVGFTDATANNGFGEAPISDWTYDDITLIRLHGPFKYIVRAEPSELGSGGDNFTIDWVHS